MGEPLAPLDVKLGRRGFDPAALGATPTSAGLGLAEPPGLPLSGLDRWMPEPVPPKLAPRVRESEMNAGSTVVPAPAPVEGVPATAVAEDGPLVGR